MNNLVIHLCLAGGLGTRLGELSPAHHPKQFKTLKKGYSLFQESLKRNITLCDFHYVVTHKSLHLLAKVQAQNVKGLKPLTWILEPSSKNTFAATILAALKAIKQHPNCMLIMTPSDHFIPDIHHYEKTLKAALKIAEQGKCILLGISATSTSTEFGYLQSTPNQGVRFIEKPILEMAKQLLNEPNTYWNAGLVICRADILLAAASELASTQLQPIQNAFEQRINLAEDTFEVPLKAFNACQKVSLDVALLEPLSQQQEQTLHLLPADFEWQDLGSPENLLPHLPLETAMTERSWGTYRVVEHKPGFYKIKQLEVNPHSSLSLQTHQYRSEHWSVIQGIATIQLEDKLLTLNPQESLQIPIGHKHKLQNQQNTPLILIEVQVGQLTVEDDIIRF